MRLLVGKRIKMLRKRTRMRQNDLSWPNWSRSFLSRLESGKTTPSLNHLAIIAEKLDTTCSDLIGDNIQFQAGKNLLFSPKLCRDFLGNVPQGPKVRFLLGLVECVENRTSPKITAPLNSEEYHIITRVCIYVKDYDKAISSCLKGLKHANAVWRVRLLLLLCQIYQELNNIEGVTQTKVALKKAVQEFTQGINLDQELYGLLASEDPSVLSQETIDDCNALSWAIDISRACSLID